MKVLSTECKQGNNLTNLVICLKATNIFLFFFVYVKTNIIFWFLVYFYLENNFFFFINPRQSLYVFVPGERLIFIIFCWCNIYMYYKKIYTQYANQCFDKFRNLVKWKSKWYVVYFGVIFFEVQARVFVQLIFSGTFINFCFMVFTQVMMKELASVLIHVCKIFNYVQAVFWNAVAMCLVNCWKRNLNIAAIQ